MSRVNSPDLLSYKLLVYDICMIIYVYMFCNLHGELYYGVEAEHGTTGHSLWWLDALMGSGSMIDITDAW